MSDDMPDPMLRVRAQRALQRTINPPAPARRDRIDPHYARRLDAALQSLPEQTRMIFLAARFEGKSYREIARATCVPVADVERHMRDAIGCLDRALREEP
jgi:RNA polymerase sigma factor (sigma-70 family)